MEFYQASVLAGTVALITILSARARLPAVLSIVIGMLVFALVSRMTYPSIGDTFSLGFAQTLDSFGLFIVAGVIMTTVLEQAGALTQGRCAPRKFRSIAAAGLGLAGSLGPSSTTMLAVLRPWCEAIAAPGARGRAVAVMAVTLALGAGQAFLFPSFYMVATRDILGVELASLLGIGLPLAVVTAAAGAAYVAWAVPRTLPADSAIPAGDASTQSPPSGAGHALVLPALIALAFLTIATFAQIPSEPLGRSAKELFVFLSRPTVVIVLTVGLTLLLIKRWDSVAVSEDGWIGKALTAAVRPLLAVAAAGGFIATIQATGMAELVAEHISFIKAGVVVPFLVALALKALQGSAMTATLTACTLIQPLLPVLGLDAPAGRAAAALAIGAGTLVAHVNDPLFWLAADMAKVSPARALMLHSLGGLIQALIAIAILIAIA